MSSTTTTASGSFSNRNILGLAHNNNGTPASWSTRYLRAYAITTGMSAAEVTAFNTHMQAFQAALNRNV
jgi:hypothetical protein